MTFQVYNPPKKPKPNPELSTPPSIISDWMQFFKLIQDTFKGGENPLKVVKELAENYAGKDRHRDAMKILRGQ